MHLELREVTHRFPGMTRPAVAGVTLAVLPGKVMVLAGPSGSGKTTLLRLVAGLEQLQAGEICGNGDRWNDRPPEQRPVAMVFQSGALFPHLTVRENLTLGLRLQKTPPAEISVRLEETAARLGLACLLDRLPENLSGGERQRVALGRALMRRPRLLLLDEPLAGLDAPLRRELRAEIARWSRAWVPTVLWVTHDAEEALAVADWMAVLHEGRLEQTGTPRQLCEQPANRFVAQFLGWPPLNLLTGQWATQDGAWQIRAPAATLQPPAALLQGGALAPAVGAQVQVGFRPADVTAVPAPGDSHFVVESVESGWGGAFCRVNAGGRMLCVTVPPEHAGGMAPGQAVRLEWHWEHALWFDPETGRRLAVGAG